MKEKFNEIGRLFRLKGEVTSYQQITAGNINTTYRVYFGSKSYIFQKVNVSVFKDPIGVMKNIDNVTTYIREEYPDQISLHYHHTVYGDNYIIYEGEFWRVMSDFNSVTLDSCDSLEDIKSIGEAFGEFQRKLTNFDCSCLVESIKDFHNTEVRINSLLDYADSHDVHMEEVEYIRSVKDEASKISKMLKEGKLPSRPCHNDTKANNVLLDKDTHKPLVVIDLDTIMPGTGLYDFADCARFICATAVEDEKDLSKVDFDLTKFEAFSEGFLGRVKDASTEEEKANVVLSVFAITIELASRFLLDYLSGNHYFKCNYEEHNIVRTRCQLKLAKSIRSKFDEMEAIVSNIFNN